MKQIDPNNIEFKKENVFLTLGLIRNDFSDFIRLQSLWVNSEEPEKFKEHKKEGKKVTPEIGRVAGVNLYILRLGLSYLYNCFEFIREDKDLIEANEEFMKLIDNLSAEYKEKWQHFLRMASSDYKNTKQVSDVDNDDLLTDDEKLVLKASMVIRHNFTYHYRDSSLLLSRGLEIAYKNRDDPNTESAFAIDPDSSGDINIKKYRSFYIDLAFQKYMEDKLALDDDLTEALKDPFANVISHFLLMISMILKEYHDNRT